MSWKKALLVNYRFSYFRPFTYDVITQNTTHSKISIFIGVIPQGRHLGRRREYTKKATKKHRKGSVQSKKWYPSHKFLHVLFPIIQSFLLGFSWSSDSITASNQKCTAKKEFSTVSEITIQYLHKDIKILLLCQCWLIINAEVSKNSIDLNMCFSTYSLQGKW